MSEWIHCNKCFLRFPSNMKFYITSCCHIKCQLCLSKMGPENRCLICNSMCKTEMLSNDLQPDVLRYFQPALETIDTAMRVSKFQLNNAQALLRAITAKYTAAKTEIAKNCKVVHDLKKQQHCLKMQLKSLARASHAANAVPTPAASTSMMSQNSTYGTTPMSSGSSNSFFQFKNPNPRPMQWDQPCNAAKMTMHRQHHNMVNQSNSKPVPFTGRLPGSTQFNPARTNSTTSNPVPFCGRLPGSTQLFPARTNNTTSKPVRSFGNLPGSTPCASARHNRENTTPQNPTTFSLARLHLDSNNIRH